MRLSTAVYIALVTLVIEISGCASQPQLTSDRIKILGTAKVFLVSRPVRFEIQASTGDGTPFGMNAALVGFMRRGSIDKDYQSLNTVNKNLPAAEWRQLIDQVIRNSVSGTPWLKDATVVLIPNPPDSDEKQSLTDSAGTTSTVFIVPCLLINPTGKAIAVATEIDIFLKTNDRGTYSYKETWIQVDRKAIFQSEITAKEGRKYLGTSPSLPFADYLEHWMNGSPSLIEQTFRQSLPALQQELQDYLSGSLVHTAYLPTVYF